MTKFDTKHLIKGYVSKDKVWNLVTPRSRLYRPDWKFRNIIGEIKVSRQFSSDSDN